MSGVASGGGRGGREGAHRTFTSSGWSSLLLAAGERNVGVAGSVVPADVLLLGGAVVTQVACVRLLLRGHVRTCLHAMLQSNLQNL